MEIKLNITKNNYKLFKEIGDMQDISPEQVIEDYFLLNKEIPTFKIARKDKYFTTVLLNIINELELLKEEVLKSKEKIKSKEKQYKYIHRNLDFVQIIIDNINDKYDNCELNQVSENKKKDQRNYFIIINKLHEIVTNDHWKLIDFLNILTENFDEIKKITLE